MRHRALIVAAVTLAVTGLAAQFSAAAVPTPTAPAKAATSTASAKAATPTAPTKAEAPKAPAGDPIMGQYTGTHTSVGGSPLPAEAKVASLGGGGYQIYLVWTEAGKTQRLRWEAQADGNKLDLGGNEGGIEIAGAIADRKLTAEMKGKFSGKFDLAWEACKSPSDGEAPSEGAIVLLPKTEGAAPSTAEWTNGTWKGMPDGSMITGTGNNSTKKSFGDCRLHVEFLVPFEPDKSGQDRGKSGIFLEGRYEIQILDSFGQDPKIDEGGAITGVKAPRSSAGFPPGQWQTYDIVFRAPKVEAGAMYKVPVITVVQNGAKIHDVVKVDHTTAGGVEGPPVEAAPLMLQDGGHAVRFRNIWLLPLKEGDLGGL